MKKFLSLFGLCSMLIATPIFASNYPVADGIDVGPAPTSSNTRYYNNEKAYSSSGFKTGVWIGNGDEYRTRGSVMFVRPYQTDRDNPYNSISITYQVYNTSDNEVRDSETLRGSYEHDDFTLAADDTYSKAYLHNNSGVYAEVDGTFAY